jgi:hypothetical protein
MGVELPGGDFGANCLVHGGNKQIASAEAKSLKNYNLTKFRYRQEIERLGDNNNIKSLRDEIGILRMLLEQRLEGITSDIDLMIQSSAISDMVLKIDKLVSSCHKLEGSMGHLLDKQAILQFGQEIIAIVGSRCTEEQTAEIAEAIFQTIGRIGHDS